MGLAAVTISLIFGVIFRSRQKKIVAIKDKKTVDHNTGNTEMNEYATITIKPVSKLLHPQV